MHWKMSFLHSWNEESHQHVGFLGHLWFLSPPHLILQVTTCSLSRSRIWFLSLLDAPRWKRPRHLDRNLKPTNGPLKILPDTILQNGLIMCLTRSFPETHGSELTPENQGGQWLGSMKFPFWVPALISFCPNKMDWTMPHNKKKTTSAATMLLIFAFLHYAIRSRLVYIYLLIYQKKLSHSRRYKYTPSSHGSVSGSWTTTVSCC